MVHLLVPIEAAATEVTISALVIGETPGSLTMEVGDGQSRSLDGGWARWDTHGQPRLWAQRVAMSGLDPGRRYPIRVVEAGVERATAVAVTLPDRLPALDEPPFICLLGSCFANLKDQEGTVGAAYARLPAAARPHLKFLSGDQVYLDAPWQKYLANVYGDDDLRGQLLTTYAATWAQGGAGRGYRELLRDGANFFTSDDHEVWNNAPSATPIVRQTWWPFGDHGRSWRQAAGELYDLFQASSRSAAFRVGRLSFRVADVRLARSGDRTTFMPSGELGAIGDWVDALDGPGALVLGQPVLVARTGLKGHVADWGLADYAQYTELASILHRSRHDLLVLTGDVHYGRVAGSLLPSGATLIEIIASPFALVDSLVGGSWHRPPDRFPAFAIPGLAGSTVWTQEDHRLAENHFATLEFAAHGSRVSLTVRAWRIPRTATAPTSILVHQRYLD